MYYSINELKQVIQNHAIYLKTGDVSKRADLRGAYLRCADLRCADLRGAYLNDADLRGADLSGAYLSGATLPESFEDKKM